MGTVLSVTLPIYLLIAAGFAAVRLGYVSGEDMRALGRVVLRLCIPATLFMAILRVPINEALRWDFLIGYGAGSLVVFAGGLAFARWALGKNWPVSVLAGLGSSSSNSGFMGYPVVALVLGNVALQAFSMALIIENIVMIPLAMLLADGRRGGLWTGVLHPMLTNPLLLAVAGAVTLSALGLALPSPLQGALEMLAPVGPPVALLAVGGAIATLPFAPLRDDVGAVVLAKLIAHPLAVLAALSAVGGMPADLVLAGMLFASVPMMSIYALLGQRFGGEDMAAAALLLATGLSFFTVSALLWFQPS
jgi:malonate transporter and related proteins